MTDLRLAVIGLGYWGPKIVRNLEALPHTQVAIVADLDAYRLASLAASQPWIKTTTQVEDVLRSDVDGVIIATPVKTHYQLAKKSFSPVGGACCPCPLAHIKTQVRLPIPYGSFRLVHTSTKNR